MSKKKFVDVEINATIKIEPAEHEVFLSFNDDSGAAAFHDWWNDTGTVEFNKFFQKNKENYE